MESNIFKEDIKSIAKKLVAASDHKIKQTEALNLLAKMEGYPSYNESFRIIANAKKDFEKILNAQISELNEQWQKIKTLDFYDMRIKEARSYCYKLLRVIENFFLFKDNSNLHFYYYEGVTVFKRLLELDIYEVYTSLSEEVIEDLKKLGIIDEIEYKSTQGSILKNINTMHPRKFITWFKNYFDLKYRYFNDSYFLSDFTPPINSSIEINKTSIEYVSFDETNLLEKGFIEDLLIKTGFYLIDIDYFIPNKEMKVRLSYSFCEIDLEKELCHFNLEDAAEFKSTYEYVLNELNEKSDYIDTAVQIFDSCLESNAFVYSLEGIQFTKIKDEFKFNIVDFKNEKDCDIYEYLDSIEMSGNLLSPFSSISLINQNEFVMNTLFAKNYKNTHTIFGNLFNYETLENEIKFGSYSERRFNHGKDLTYGVYKYAFTSIDESLVYIMNTKLKEILAEVFTTILEKKAPL